ncbi:MAG: serine protein kinase PrkA [Desulfobacterales bacterium]
MKIKSALEHLDKQMSAHHRHRRVLSFEALLTLLMLRPELVIRNVFQVFHDMFEKLVGKGVDEYPDDPESIQFVKYDFGRLFVEGTDHPFFADRLFANRLIKHVEALKRGAQQNKIYIFDGPPGCGKSTFLNNLLLKFEEYANSGDGVRFETIWRLEKKTLSDLKPLQNRPLFDGWLKMMDSAELDQDEALELTGERKPPEAPDAEEPSPEGESDLFGAGCIEIPCPSHDHPILMVPKIYRRSFFDDLLENQEFKWKLFTEKEYDWVFKQNPCTICSSLFDALLEKLGSPRKVFERIFARPYLVNRRIGEGVSVFNPGDRPPRQHVLSNPMLQGRINAVLEDSNRVQYLFSRYAKTNNGIYALMDIKSHNTERLIELHNIISEGVHKIDDIEENVDSLFFALMNPEDKKNIQDIQSFSDRIEYIRIPYVLDLNTEVEIYRNIFGRHIDDYFLPRTLHNFARVIISSRIHESSEALKEWIQDPGKYRLFCDTNLQLLKMEIYTGHIPLWLTEEDRKRFTAKRRRRIIGESQAEGEKGFSGRDSIKIFNDFFSAYAREDKLINMATLCNYFGKVRTDLNAKIPGGFLESLHRMYDYTILQEVKESLYYFNEEQISRDLQNYLFALNFEPGTTETSKFTGDRIEITEEYLSGIENRILGAKVSAETRRGFRTETQREYTSKTLTQEIMLENKQVLETALYQKLYERCLHNIKEKALDPFLENENFRRAIKDWGGEDFKTYDRKIREDVTYLVGNLVRKYRYTEIGAREVCIYVIDQDLARRYAENNPGP